MGASYCAIVFDASFCLTSFPNQLFEMLSKDGRFYASVSVRSVFEELSELFQGYPKRYDQICKCFQSFENRIIFRNTIDTWYLLQKLIEENNGRILMATVDESLMRRIILRNTKVDIYDLSTNELIYQEDFESLEGKYAFPIYGSGMQGGVQVSPQYRYASEIELYNESGKKYTFAFCDNEDMKGSEAGIYYSDQYQGMLAKVFPKEQFSEEKKANIKWLHKQSKYAFPWWLVPKELLFWDENCNDLAGYLQDYIRFKVPMEHMMFLGDISDDEFTPREALRRCINLTRQIAILNYKQITVSDFNMSNFALPEDNPEYIYMWDTDSFCTPVFRPWMMEDPNALPKQYKVEHPLESYQMCVELLYVSVLKILAMGRPIVTYNSPHEFVLLPKDPNEGRKLRFVPPRALDLYVRAYCKRDIVLSVEALLHALHCSKHEKVVGDVPYDVPYMETLDKLEPWTEGEILLYLEELRSEKEAPVDGIYDREQVIPPSRQGKERRSCSVTRLPTVRTPGAITSYPEDMITEYGLVSVDPKIIADRKSYCSHSKRYRINRVEIRRRPSLTLMYIMLALVLLSTLVLLYLSVWDSTLMELLP